MQNGVAEHINKTIQDRVTTMVQHSELKLEFWAEALQTKEIRLKVSQALWSGKELAYNRLHIFGCEAYVLIPWEKRTNLSPHAMKCIFLSYGTDGEFSNKEWDSKNQILI